MAGKDMTIFNERYRPMSRQGSSVFAELDKTSVTQANDLVGIKVSTSPHWTKVVAILVSVLVVTAIVTVTTVVVMLNSNGGGEETVTDSPADATPGTTTGQSTDSPADATPDTTTGQSTVNTTGSLKVTTEHSTTSTTTEPGDILWSDWGDWTDCTASCDSGIHRRYRHCTTTGSAVCVGDYVETKICGESTCPVYGKWTTWSTWGSCDVTCGGGTQFRTRTCNKIDPSDLECVGGDSQEKTCSDWNCPDCSTVCSVGTLNGDCDMCICDGSIITGRIVAESSGNPVSNAAFYNRAAPTSILTTSNSTGFFTLESTCESSELLVSREGFVDTVIVANDAYLEITMPKIVLPHLSETPQTKCRLTGENVTFCCEATANPPIEYFEWLKNDVLLDHDLHLNGNQLTLKDLSPASSGRYQCRANSLAGAVMSSAATLTVKEKADDFCADALQTKTISLPSDCIQSATNTSLYDVGECISKTCRENSSADSGLCSEDIASCCKIEDAVLRTVQCSGYEMELIVVRSCSCGTCTVSPLTISGTAVGLEDQAPLRFGEVWVNGALKGYTSSSGNFNFKASSTSSKITITLKDNFFKQFLPAIKVIEISDSIGGTLHVHIWLTRIADPVEIDSNIENTLVAGSSVNDASTPIVQISIPANAFYRSDGTQYSGTVQASLTFLDPTNTSILESMPGVFEFVDEEGQTGNLASLGVFNLYFEDTDGNPLVLDEVVDLYVPMEVGLNVTKNNLKLWKMNSDTGVWEVITSGAGTRRRKRQNPALWVGEIDWSTVTDQDWFNYDYVYSLTDNPCYFKIRLFKDKNLTEPVLDPGRGVYVSYHILDGNVLTTIEDYLYRPDDQCTTGICENQNAFVTLHYYGSNQYQPLYAAEPQIGLGNHEYNITDEEKVLKIQMSASDEGPFYVSETTCIASDSNSPHLKYNYGKEFKSFIYNELFVFVGGIEYENNLKISSRTWYPEREEGIRACFMKVRILFETGIELSSEHYMKLKATSYGGIVTNIQDFILGVQEYDFEHENTTYCIEYKCSGTINPFFDVKVRQVDYTRVVLALTNPSDEVSCEVSDEADLISSDVTSLNQAQVGSTNGTYEFYAPVVHTPAHGLYSSTSDQLNVESAKDIAKKECRSGEVQNLDDDKPDIGVGVTFTCRRKCYQYYFWWYVYWC